MGKQIILHKRQINWFEEQIEVLTKENIIIDTCVLISNFQRNFSAEI